MPEDPNLTEEIRECFLSQKMSAASVESILAEGRKEQKKHNRAWWRPWVPVAAVFAVVLGTAFGLGRHYDVSAFAKKVAGEIAMRHNGTRPLDVEANSFDAVQEGLSELSFSVTPQSRQGLLSAYELVGARYCYLEGQQGVHVRVKDRKTGELCTLYIASLEGPLEELRYADHEVHLKGNEVTLWEDDRRLFALVE